MDKSSCLIKQTALRLLLTRGISKGSLGKYFGSE